MFENSSVKFEAKLYKDEEKKLTVLDFVQTSGELGPFVEYLNEIVKCFEDVRKMY